MDDARHHAQFASTAGWRRRLAAAAAGALVAGTLAGAVGALLPAAAGASAHPRARAVPSFGQSAPQAIPPLQGLSAPPPSPTAVRPALSPTPPALGPSADTYTVDTVTDTTPTTPAAACATGNAGTCSVRAAVEAADLVGQQNPTAVVTVDIPAGTYTLTQGELVATNPGGLVLQGASATTTVVQQTPVSLTATTPTARVLLETYCGETALPAVAHFNPHCTTDTTAAGPVTELDDLTLKGGVATRDPFDTGAGGGILADAEGGGLVLNGAVVTANRAVNGGGIAVEGDVWIDGSTVWANTAAFNRKTHESTRDAYAEGGGIALEGAAARLTDSKVLDNRAGLTATKTVTTTELDTPARDDVYAEGGGIWDVYSPLNVTGGSVSGNQAVAPDRDAKVYGSDAEGGGIWAEGGSVTVTGSAITHDSVTATPTKPESRAEGGGVSADTVANVVSTTLSDDTASGTEAGGGGGIFFDSTLSGDTLTNDVAHGATSTHCLAAYGPTSPTKNDFGECDGSAGGAEGYTLSVTGSNVSDDQATGFEASAGGLATEGSTTMSGDTLDNDSATGSTTPLKETTTHTYVPFADAGAIEVEFDDPLTISSTTVSGSSVKGEEAAGGGLLLAGPTALAGDSVVDNSATGRTEADGGGIFSVDGGLTLSGTGVTGNAVVSTTLADSEADGGGIYVESEELLAGLTVDGGSIHQNRASATATASHDHGESAGGGLYAEDIEEFPVPVTVTGAQVTGNSAVNGYGGGLAVAGADVTLTDDVVSGNSATSPSSGSDGYGGGISTGEGQTTVTGTTVDDNHATLGGGGISLFEGRLVLRSSTLGNNASNFGAGVLVTEGSDLDAEASAIVDNVASGPTTALGGGIAVGYASVIDLTHATVAGNSAPTGSGIFASGGSRTYPTRGSTPTTFTTYAGSLGGTFVDSTVADNRTPAGAENDCTFGTPYTTGPAAKAFTSGGGNAAGDFSCQLTAATDRQGKTAQGYTLVGNTGGVYNFETPFLGSLPGDNVHVSDVGGTADVPGGGGYWMFGKDGGVFSFGDAQFDGSVPGVGVHVTNIVAMAATPTGGGYWLVGATGGVYSFGNAPFEGSVPGVGVSVDNIVGMAATPDGEGYILVGSTGGVYAFGDAQFHGSLPGVNVHVTNVVGMTLTSTGEGYYMVGSTGGVYSFGTARFVPTGSVPGVHVHVTNITTLSAMPTGGGYWVFGDTGGVYSFGTAQFHGSVPGAHVFVTNVVGGFSI